MPPEQLRATDALFLDFDGTLVEIADHPARVLPPTGLPQMLDAARTRLGGALAIVTGRSLEDVDGWLRPFRFAGGGLHGAQLRSRYGGQVAMLEERAVTAIAEAAVAALRGHEGTWVEDKGSAVALHYRGAPLSAPTCLAVADELAGRFGLRAVPGKMVVEIRSHGTSKGSVVQALMQLPPFAGRRPVFVGDDVTDEDGFAAAAALGGFGIRIGPGETGARYTMPGVRALLAWLSADMEEDRS